MKPPTLAGLVDRRILVNYAVDPTVAGRLLPPPFRPQLVNGNAVAGICLIRLTRLRPAGLPAWVGVSSENAAHRVAVEWDDEDGTRTGVFIPRRDTGSALTRALGGRLFPGEHERAVFTTNECDSHLEVAYSSRDGAVSVDVQVELTQRLGRSELFGDLEEASEFFRKGSVGLSARGDALLDGLSLRTDSWSVEPAAPRHVRSSFFEDPALFPPGSARLDCVLVMRGVPVTWRATAGPSCEPPAADTRAIRVSAQGAATGTV